jgi:hypothetical protein
MFVVWPGSERRMRSVGVEFNRSISAINVCCSANRSCFCVVEAVDFTAQTLDLGHQNLSHLSIDVIQALKILPIGRKSTELADQEGA